MRKCPNCNKITIDTKWLLLNKFKNDNKYCFKCPNCNTKIRKQKNLILDFLTIDIFTIGILIFLLATIIEKYLPSFIYTLIILTLCFTILHFSTEYFAKLKVAEENYCLHGLSKKGAFFALLIMTLIILYTVYSLIINPLIF